MPLFDPACLTHWEPACHNLSDHLVQVRLHFLSTLLDEAHSHLHNHLCASVLGLKLVALPFNRRAQRQAMRSHACRRLWMRRIGSLLGVPLCRDVQITAQGVRAMHACLQYAMQVIRGVPAIRPALPGTIPQPICTQRRPSGMSAPGNHHLAAPSPP